MKRILLVVLDGLGDRPCKLLDSLTPLQAAYRPNLNTLVSSGIGGLMYPVRKGLVCGSDTSHLSLLGYDPEVVYTGRGPFEAMGIGIKVKPGDIAFRANFATRDDKGIIIDRRAGREIPESPELAKAISMSMDGVEYIVKEGVEHRAALVMRGKSLSPDVSDSDPHLSGKKASEILPLSKEAEHTSRALNLYLAKAREILDHSEQNVKRRRNGLPSANELLLRGAGIAPQLERFDTRYGISGACLAGIPLITGIADLIGMKILKHNGSTGSIDTDYRGKVKTAIAALKENDFVLLNIKAPDVAGHDGSPELKRQVMEWIDAALEPALDILENTVICITGDHSTPAELKEHSGDPVPILFATDNMRKNNVRHFDEESCSKEGIEILSGDVMNTVLQLANKSDKFGA